MDQLIVESSTNVSTLYLAPNRSGSKCLHPPAFFPLPPLILGALILCRHSTCRIPPRDVMDLVATGGGRDMCSGFTAIFQREIKNSHPTAGHSFTGFSPLGEAFTEISASL